MAFLDNLQASGQQLGSPSSGGSGAYFGQPSQDVNSASDELNSMMPLFHQIRNRNLQDFAAKTRIAGDESIRQNHLAKVFGFDRGGSSQGGNSDGSPNVVYRPPEKDPATTPISPFQAAGLNLDRQKLALDASQGQAKQALGEKQFGLATQKNENIRDQKEADLTQKASEANRKLEQAQQRITNGEVNAEAIAQFHQSQMDAQKAQHELENHQKDAALAETTRLNDARIADIKDKADKAGFALQESTDPTGNKTTTVVKRGSVNDPANSGGNINMVGPDGKTYQIPYANVDHAQQQGMKFVGK